MLYILFFEYMDGLLGNLLICDPVFLEALAYSLTEGQTQRLGWWEADASWQCYGIQLRFLSKEAGKKEHKVYNAKNENQQIKGKTRETFMTDKDRK